MQHKEAYALMRYQNETTGEYEALWNSRDGVTSFTVSSRDGRHTMKHVDWDKDIFAPNWIPNIGDRIFVDITEERAEESIKEQIETMWERSEMPMKDHFASKEDAFQQLMKGAMESVIGKQPMLTEVDAKLQLEIAAKQKTPIHSHPYRMKWRWA